MPTLEGTKRWKPDREDLIKELKKLGLEKESITKIKNEDVVLDPENPVDKVVCTIIN